MDVGPRYTIAEFLSIVQDVSSTYLKSQQYDVNIEEHDGTAARQSTLDMTTFLLKACARRFAQCGVPPAHIAQALKRLHADPSTHPVPDTGLTVFGTTVIRFSDGVSPVRAER
jgi:hypothetical protein